MNKRIISILVGFVLLLSYISCDLANNSGDSSENTDSPEIVSVVNSDGSIIISGSGKKTIVLTNDQKNKKVFLGRYNKGNADSTKMGEVKITRNNRSVYEEEIPVSLNIEQNIDENEVINIPFHPEFDVKPIKSTSRNIINAQNEVYSTQLSGTLNIGDTFSFTTVNNNNTFNNTECQGAVLKVIGTHCNVWYKEKVYPEGYSNDDKYSVDYSYFTNIANKFDQLYEKINFIFGLNYSSSVSYTNIIPTDINTKINIVVYDIYNDYQKDQSSGTFGYFASYNFIKNSGEGAITASNEAEIIYIDSYFLQKSTISTNMTYLTLAHEYQHLLHFFNKSLINKVSSKEWYTEMLSMVCEDICQNELGIGDGSTPKNRLSDFNNGSYNGFDPWLSGNDVFYSYANAYAFGAYLLRNYGGIELIALLAQNEYSNKEAITQALQFLNYNETFDSVFAKFTNIRINNSNITLNKGSDNDFGYKYTPINLWNSNYKILKSKLNHSEYGLNYLYFNEMNNNTNYYIGPIIFNHPYYNTTLKTTGCQIAYLGTNIDKIEINKDPEVDMIVIFQ